jgi:hypothetical protein
MECKKFWEAFEESGLNSELERHLNSCDNCREEMKIEHIIQKNIREIPLRQAPDTLWDKVKAEIPSTPEKEFMVSRTPQMPLIEKIKKFFIGSGGRTVPLRPVVIAFTLLIMVAASQFIDSPSVKDKEILQAQAVLEIQKTESMYLAAIEKLSGGVEENEDVKASDLYVAYTEKIAVLDEYILQCKEAINLNNYNISAHKNLFLAYKEKVETLKKMTDIS